MGVLRVKNTGKSRTIERPGQFPVPIGAAGDGLASAVRTANDVNEVVPVGDARGVERGVERGIARTKRPFEAHLTVLRVDGAEPERDGVAVSSVLKFHLRAHTDDARLRLHRRGPKRGALHGEMFE